jgi:hypothetical protein
MRATRRKRHKPTGNAVVDLHRAIIGGEDPRQNERFEQAAEFFGTTRETVFLWDAKAALPARTAAELVRRAPRPRVPLPAPWRRRLRQEHRMPARWEAVRAEVLGLRRLVDAAWAAVSAATWDRVAALDADLDALEEQLEAAAWEWYTDRGDTASAHWSTYWREDPLARAEAALRGLLRDDECAETEDESGGSDEQALDSGDHEDQSPLSIGWQNGRELRGLADVADAGCSREPIDRRKA